MNTFKRYLKRSKSRVYAVLCMIALISINCVPMVSAADYTGNVTVAAYIRNNTGWTARQATSLALPVSNYNIFNSATGGFGVTTDSYMSSGFTVSGTFTSPVNVYFSYYVRLQNNGSLVASSLSPFSASSYNATYYNQLEQVGYLNSFDVSSFSPNDSYAHSTGVIIQANFRGTELEPIKNPSVIPKEDVGFKRSGNSYTVGAVIPSLRVVTAQTSAELDALDNLASEIAAQSEILSAMKGEIVSILQDIYLRTGDMLEAQNLLNAYMEQLLPLINSINNNTSNIYSLLSTQFELLRAAIATESQNIQDAIEKQTEDLKAYFDDVLGGAVGTLPDDSASADDIINESHDDEQQYHSDALNRFNELSASFNGFNGDIGSGIALVGTLFSRVWGALGNYVIVYTFPLLLGLALVIIGRLGRGMVKKSSQDRNPDE